MTMALVLSFLYLFIITVQVALMAVADNITFTTIDTKYGTIRGKLDYSVDVPIAKFFGIRFAKPPIGPLRFKEPMAPDTWSGIKDTLHFGSECLQRSSYYGGSIRMFNNKDEDLPPSQSEDCLYLNVYAPMTNAQSRLPVMFWLHGGGFLKGAGSQYDATSLATKGVIVVTMNYRLDVFGFFSTEDDVMPGNYGALDQVAALKWVKENIVSFGGDSNRVTVFGQSAGAASVSHLILSPLAKGLFHRGIIQSGASISKWATAHPGNRVSPSTLARLISVTAKCNELDNSTQLLSCLQQVDSHVLLNISNSVEAALNSGFIFNPRVETKFGFLPDLPIKLLYKGEFNHVDTIHGFNSDEVSTFFAPVSLNMSKVNFIKALDARMPKMLTQYTYLDGSKILSLIHSLYLTESSSNDVLRRQIADAGDDLAEIASVVKEASLYVPIVQGKKHYMYEFNHRPSFRDKDKDYPKWLSAVHTDELEYIFNTTRIGGGPKDDGDMSVVRQVMKMWTNFAKTGDPNDAGKTNLDNSSSINQNSWKPYSRSFQNYLFINNVSVSKIWSRPQTMQFYDRVLEIMDGAIPQGDTNNIIG